MKEMSKEDLQKSFSGLSEEEIDEDLTKRKRSRKIVETLKGMDEADVLKFVEKYYHDKDKEKLNAEKPKGMMSAEKDKDVKKESVEVDEEKFNLNLHS